MIQLPNATSCAGIERFGLDRLVDLSRLLPAPSLENHDLVRLQVSDRGPVNPGLRDCMAHDWYYERADGIVTIPRGVLSLVGEVAGAVSEQHSTRRDRYGRVPPSDNALVANRLEQEPVISLAALALRDAVSGVAGRRPVRLLVPWPGGRRWAAAFTHDLDLVALWPLAVSARIAELVRKGELRRAGQALVEALRSLGRNPVSQGIRAVLDAEASCDVPSTWFLLCETPTLRSVLNADVTYHPESEDVRRIMSLLRDHRCEVGLHGSFASAEGDGVFSCQRLRLAGLTGSASIGVRQHFLKMRPGATHQRMRAAGFAYDSTCGFSDRNGFRLGVADVTPVWDATAGAPVGIEEAPFCWMERAMSKYQAIEDPVAWVDQGLALADRCRAVDGLWVGVWHPNVHPATGFPGSAEAFARLVRAMAAEQPFLGSLSEVVAWRMSRRSVRVRAIASNGDVVAVAGEGRGFAHMLEDSTGRVRETVAS